MTPNIQDTEAAVVADSIRREKAVMTKIAGVIGEEYVKLYPEISDITGKKGYNPAVYFGIGLDLSRTTNFLKVCSSVPELPLRKNDLVVFTFEDLSMIRVPVMVSGWKMAGAKHVFCVITNSQLYKFYETLVVSVAVINNKTGVSLSAGFTGLVPNYQYQSARDGQKLLQIVTERAIGAKEIIVKNLTN